FRIPLPLVQLLCVVCDLLRREHWCRLFLLFIGHLDHAPFFALRISRILEMSETMSGVNTAMALAICKPPIASGLPEAGSKPSSASMGTVPTWMPVKIDTC